VSKRQLEIIQHRQECFQRLCGMGIRSFRIVGMMRFMQQRLDLLLKGKT